MAASEKLQCDLASLLPLSEEEGSEQDQASADLLLPGPVKLEDLDIIELPPRETPVADIAGLENLTSDETCSDLVSAFANDAASEPVSLDDFMM